MIVFDASAVLAILKSEPGAEAIVSSVREALISAVNLIEVRSKLIDIVTDPDRALRGLDRLELSVIAFDRSQAIIAANLWPQVRRKNVSLADRACLALAIERNATVVTADRKWAELTLPVDIKLIR